MVYFRDIVPSKPAQFINKPLAPFSGTTSVLGFFQQQKELRQNTEALEAQAKELRLTVEQHKLMVKEVAEQSAIQNRALALEVTKAAKELHPKFGITDLQFYLADQEMGLGLDVEGNEVLPDSSFATLIFELKNMGGGCIVDKISSQQGHVLHQNREALTFPLSFENEVQDCFLVRFKESETIVNLKVTWIDQISHKRITDRIIFTRSDGDWYSEVRRDQSADH